MCLNAKTFYYYCTAFAIAYRTLLSILKEVENIYG